MGEKLYKTIQIRGRAVNYFLITEFIQDGKLVYGFRLNYGEEEIMIRNLTSSFEAVRKLLDMLVCGEVTPVTVPDIVEDWLAW